MIFFQKFESDDNSQVESVDIFSSFDDKSVPSSKIDNIIEIDQIRLVDYWVEGTRVTFPGVVLESKTENGIDGYMLQFEDQEEPVFIPTYKLLEWPIQKVKSENLFVESDDDDVMSTIVDSETFDSDDGLSDKDVDLNEREKLSILDENSDNNDPIVFDCSIKSKDSVDESNEVVPVLGDDYYENFPEQKKMKIKNEKESKLKKSIPCQQTTHISKQRDEKRTLSSFVGSKMSHTPCGPDQPNGTKQDCWR